MPSPTAISPFIFDRQSPPPLQESILLPLTVRRRRFSSSNTRFTGSQSDTLQLFDDLLAIGGSKCRSREATFLHLLDEYNIDMNALQYVAATRLKRSFSRTTYTAIAGIFGLDPADTALANIPQFNMQRSWLPLAVVHEICSDVEAVNVRCGPMIVYDNEEVRRHYIAAIVGRVVHLFGRKVMDYPEELLHRRNTDHGRFWHQFVAFGVAVTMVIQVRRDLLVGKARANQIAQVLAEADACDYGNSCAGLWVPIIGILSDSENFEFFVYDSSTRSFSLSAPIKGLGEFQSDVGFLRSIKRVAEYMYDMFLTGYINSLRAVLEHSTQVGEQAKWAASLHFAESALAHARHAASLAEDGKLDAAEETARNAVELLDRIAKEVLGMSGQHETARGEDGASLMDAWVDEEVMWL